MKVLKSILALLFITVLFSCDDSINGPSGSDLTYEPQLLTLGKEVVFGTIEKDVVKVKFAERTGSKYILKHSCNMSEECPSCAKEMWLELNMCGNKYKVTFVYDAKSNDQIWLRVYKYERL